MISATYIATIYVLAGKVSHQLTEEIMEQFINVHIERLPEGVWLATSEDVPGLVAQGGTVTETLETAKDVAKKIIEARAERF